MEGAPFLADGPIDDQYITYQKSELQKLTRRVLLWRVKNNGGLKYGGIVEKPSNLNRHN